MGKVSKDFGAVVGEALKGDGFVVEVGLGVVGEFEDHLGWVEGMRVLGFDRS